MQQICLQGGLSRGVVELDLVKVLAVTLEKNFIGAEEQIIEISVEHWQKIQGNLTQSKILVA